MNELERIKQYIGKIKSATVQQKRAASSLDKPAANRLIGHDLAGNAALDRERATRTADSNRRIQEKLADLSNIGKHTRFSNSAIMQDAQESLTPANTTTITSDDPSILSIIDDEDSPGLSDRPPEPSITNKEGDSARHPNPLAKPGKSAATTTTTTTTTMFEESKPEKKNRERRERKAAKKERQKATKAKQAAKMIG